MIDAIWIDVDGTISDCEHRMPHYKKDWKKFESEAIHDVPEPTIITVVRALARENIILIVTARSENMREITEAWLDKQCVPYDKLYMRPAKDYRPDYEMKILMLETIKKDGYNPIVAFEDRNRVVKALRDNGIKVCQVQDGDY